MEIIAPQPGVNEDGTLDVWPTLGPQVCDFIEDRMVFGPGGLKGQPYVVREDLRYIIYRAYEHYPDGYVQRDGSIETDMTGRRRFNKVNISLPKGSAKTEIMAIIALVELHPDAPVRFDGYDPDAPGGLAPGRSVVSPFIPLLYVIMCVDPEGSTGLWNPEHITPTGRRFRLVLETTDSPIEPVFDPDYIYRDIEGDKWECLDGRWFIGDNHAERVAGSRNRFGIASPPDRWGPYTRIKKESENE